MTPFRPEFRSQPGHRVRLRAFQRSTNRRLSWRLFWSLFSLSLSRVSPPLQPKPQRHQIVPAGRVTGGFHDALEARVLVAVGLDHENLVLFARPESRVQILRLCLTSQVVRENFKGSQVMRENFKRNVSLSKCSVVQKQ